LISLAPIKAMDKHCKMADQDPQDAAAGPLVAQAVERMAAAKIAVGLPPLMVLALYGLVQSFRGGFQLSDHVLLMLGAVLSMVGMIAYGLQAVSRVLEKPSRWGGLVFAGSLVPLVFGLWVIVTRVLLLLRVGGTLGFGPIMGNLALMVLAALCLRAQWKLIEVHLLAREMAGVEKLGMDRGIS
jgi:hypothetical protein